jgi:AraC-like DNA-binding protein/mannose-6-phosphate isomerase-like protein (cupin superfamily)
MLLSLKFMLESPTQVDDQAAGAHSLPMTIEPLGEALHFLRMTGTFYCRSEFTAPWGLTLPPMADCMMFHLVTSGECRLEVEGASSQTLRPGDLALVPHGAGHRLASGTRVRAPGLFDLPREPVSERYEILRHGGGGEPTTMICAVVRFDHPAAHQLVSMLPPMIRVDAWSSPEMDWIQSTLRLITSEARELRAGGETVITRLADILVIQAIRSWIASDAAAQGGWLGALRDKQIGRALTLIHRDPAQQWTLESLASKLGMSRSAFAARFTQLVGEPPMHYVARWKMHSALQWLREGKPSLADLAARLGYESEAAFSRAFKRFNGISPGSARRLSAAPAAERSA